MCAVCFREGRICAVKGWKHAKGLGARKVKFELLGSTVRYQCQVDCYRDVRRGGGIVEL